MLLKWRGDDYEYQSRIMQGGKDKQSRNSNIDGLIFGADTESVQLEGRYEPQCFTLASPWDKHLEYLPEHDFALRSLLSYWLEEYGDAVFEHPVKHAFMYFHNLNYDWLQLVKTNTRLLELAKVGVSPTEIVALFLIHCNKESYSVTMDKNVIFIGSAPQVRLKIKRESDKKTVTLHIHDTGSFFPNTLAKLGDDLGFPKLERQEDLGQVDYRPMADCEDKQYFEEYAKIDAEVTRLVAEQIRELHRMAEMTKIRASSPNYAINLLLHGMDEGEYIVSGSQDADIMQLILDTYRGGRTGGIVHGRVDHLSVADFHSSYPASMLSLPSFNKNMQYVRLDDLSLDNVLSILEETGNVFLRVSGIETDTKYPSLLTTINGKLTPIYGRFEQIATTGYELLVGIKSGSIDDLVIHDCVVCLELDDNPTLPFKEFAEKAYVRKSNAEKGSPEYISAKLALNSSYGKLIESRSQSLLGISHGTDYLPFVEGMEKEFGNYYYSSYLNMVENGGDYEDWYEEILEEVAENFADQMPLPDKRFENFNVSGNIYGRYVVPAAASLITACSRARLVAAMKCLDAIYWDTDSVFVQNLPNDKDAINLMLAPTLAWFPPNVVPVQIGDELGMLDLEMWEGSGFLAGTKRYYLEGLPLDKDGNKTIKRATHGIPALQKNEAERVIHDLAIGQDTSYTSKPRPNKAKEAKRAEDIGSFETKGYKPKFHLDERLQWTRVGDAWVGDVKPFLEQGVKELTPDQYDTLLHRLYKTELHYDPIQEGVLEHGFIQSIQTNERHYAEYQAMSRSVKQKYFRRDGLPVDVFADLIGMDINELLEKLEN